MLIPAGPFTMGSGDPRATDERPAHEVHLSAYYIDRYEVTNAQFKVFVEATGYLTTAEQEDGISWRHPEGPESDISTQLDHPVVYVSWYDARTYCGWRGKRLPTEAEWEKSARGTDGRIWPWGNIFDPGCANIWGREDGYEKTAPVGTFPSGVSPYGALIGMAKITIPGERIKTPRGLKKGSIKFCVEDRGSILNLCCGPPNDTRSCRWTGACMWASGVPGRDEEFKARARSHSRWFR